MVKCKLFVLGKKYDIGEYPNLKAAVAACMTGFGPTVIEFIERPEYNLVAFEGVRGSKSLLRQFDLSLEKMEEVEGRLNNKSIALQAVRFVREKLGDRAPAILASVWSEALIEGLEPNEVTLTIQGDLRKEELEEVAASIHS